MHIKGLQKTTLLDFPSKVACTVFTGGCNFRCPFCHNASLVLHAGELETMSEESFFSFLSKRKGILDGVCITGGEPTLMRDLPEFCKKIKDMGFAVKLDTNGSDPIMLRRMIDEKLVDYVAMDIKNSPDAYAETCGLSRFPAGVNESIDLLLSDVIPYEFRTTIVSPLHNEERMKDLAWRIRGANAYFLQLFNDSGDLLGQGLSAPSEEEARALLAAVQTVLPHAELRGI